LLQNHIRALGHSAVMHLSDVDYVRILDGLARFYSSQVTSHAGYLLTSIVVYLGFFGLVSSWIIAMSEKPLPYYYLLGLIATFIILGIAYVRLPIRYFPMYFLARLQYYIALTEAVWNHLPHNSDDATGRYYAELRRRALGPISTDRRVALGIHTAVNRLFEARLYLSCVRDLDKVVDLENCRSIGLEHYELSCEEQEIFQLSRYYRHFTFPRCYERMSVMRFWQLTELLLLAYREELKRNYQGSAVWELFLPYL
jgi:hypothetical protein